MIYSPSPCPRCPPDDQMQELHVHYIESVRWVESDAIGSTAKKCLKPDHAPDCECATL